jgi:hypothetical protein
MNKYYKITIAVLSILTIAMMVQIYKSYMTPERALIWKAEKELKSSLNDPSSYEFIEFYKKSIYEPEDGETKYEYFGLKFRANNKLGALIIDEVTVKGLKYSEDIDSEYMFVGIE